MTTYGIDRSIEGHPIGLLGRIRLDANVSLSFRQKVLAAICWGCVVGDHIAYLFRTALAANSAFSLEAAIGIEVYATVAALICWKALTRGNSR